MVVPLVVIPAPKPYVPPEPLSVTPFWQGQLGKL